jgi:hypothetical protein
MRAATRQRPSESCSTPAGEPGRAKQNRRNSDESRTDLPVERNSSDALRALLFALTSYSDHSDFPPRSRNQPFDIILVACENRTFSSESRGNHYGVDDIRRFGDA